MMIEKSGTIRLKDIHIPQGGTPEQQELAQGMVRVNHLYRSALKVAVTQLEILDEEFASLYDHSPIHHIEYRIKTVDSIVEKLKRRGFEVTIDNIYAHIQDVAGVRVICNYLTISTISAVCWPAMRISRSSGRWTTSSSPRSPATEACT